MAAKPKEKTQAAPATRPRFDGYPSVEEIDAQLRRESPEIPCPRCHVGDAEFPALHDTGMSVYLRCGRCTHTWKHTRKVVDDI